MEHEFLDRALVWFERPVCAGILARAQAAFMAETGVFESGEPWWEERIRAFHDWFLFRHLLPDGRTPLGRFAGESWETFSEAEREVYRELLGACHRSLFEVERIRGGGADLRDLVGRARYRVAIEKGPTGWERGDLIDALLLRSGSALTLSRGLIFQPRPARDAVALLVEYARAERGGAPWDVVDLFARMKLAYERSETPRVAAIYTPQSYLYRDHLARQARDSR